MDLMQSKNLTNNLCGDDVTAFLSSHVSVALTNLMAFKVKKMAIAVSGGMDSMALLHVASTAAHEQGIELCVFHVHHGLQAVADEWVDFLKGQVASYGIVFDVIHLDVSTYQPPQSIEDWARSNRYAALSSLAQKHNVQHIWLAHHQDDQIETHLLQKNRGARAKGQAAMPAQLLRNGINWQRPWLDVSRQQIEQHIKSHHLKHINDPSNDDPRFARNALRIELKATLTAHKRQSILKDILAAQIKTTQESEWAHAILAPHHVTPRRDIGEIARLEGLKLDGFSEEEQNLIVRHWLASFGARMPSNNALDELIDQLTSERIDQHMCWKDSDGYRVAKFRDSIIAAPALKNIKLSGLNDFIANPVAYGLDRHEFEKHGLTVKDRIGGERIRLQSNRPSMDLKKAYQAAAIAPMLREHLPLVYCGEKLVYASGLGLNVEKA